MILSMSEWLWKGIELVRARFSIRTGLLVLLGLALLFWDWVTLPLYGETRFSILFIPVLCSFLLFLTVLLHFFFVNQKQHDPVRRSHRSFTWDLIVLMVLNLLGFILFFKSWLFVSIWLRGIGLVLTFINFLVGFTLMLVFGMGWHRFDFQDTALRKAYIDNISNQTGNWYNLPESAVGNKKLGWANPSSLIIDTLYQRFLKLHTQTVLQLTNGHFDSSIHNGITTQFKWHRVKRQMEQSFKIGHLLALHCDLFQDKNGNHQLLACQIYWQLLNAHLSQLSLWFPTAQAPANALQHELEELDRLYQFYLAKKEIVQESISDQDFSTTWFNWQETTLNRRLCHFYLNGFYIQHFGDSDTDKKEVLEQHLKMPAIKNLEERIQQFNRLQEKPINANHFTRQVMTTLDLPSPTLNLFSLLKELQSKESKEEDFWDETFNKWKNIPYSVEGIKVKNNMGFNITRLLMITPPIQQEDMDAQTTDFQTLWQCAGIIWALTDLVYFEREIPLQHLLEFLQQLQLNRNQYPYAIQSEIQELTESEVYTIRMKEAKWKNIHKTQDLLKAVR